MMRRLIYDFDKIQEYMEKHGVSAKEAWEIMRDEYSAYAEERLQAYRDARGDE